MIEKKNSSPCWRWKCFLYLLVSSFFSVPSCWCLVPLTFRVTRISRESSILTHSWRIPVSCNAKRAAPTEDDEDEDFENDIAYEEQEEEDDDEDISKFKIAIGMEDDEIDPLPDFLTENDDTESRSLGRSSSPQPQTDAMDETQRRIEEQQRQIDLLMKMVQTSAQSQPTSTASSSSSLPPLQTQQQQPTTTNLMAPLKAMLFIDGTWLYYSIHGRRERDCPIVRKFGRGWQFRHRFDWTALPRIVCEQLQQQHTDQGWASGEEQRPMEIVRASVYTSMKNSTSPQSFRVRMFEEMTAANYDVHCMTTVGEGEKCVDIQLAVEMLHYATVPNAYDVAILLSGDKDFLPALVRTRQKGRKVGIVSMRSGCNRALYESPNVKDYNVVWIEDFLDQLFVPLSKGEDGNTSVVSRFTLMKVLYDFFEMSGLDRLSSRDVGRYMKLIEIDGGNLVEIIKSGYGGLFHFLNQGECFDVEMRTDRRSDPNDKSFWIKLHPDSSRLLLEEAKRTHFTKEEKDFFDTYSLELLDTSPRTHVYFHSIFPDRKCPAEYNYWENQTENDEEEELPAELQKDFSQYTVVQLKEYCRERGLPVSGTKAVLLERVTTDLESQTLEWREQQQQQQAQSRRRTNVNGSNASPSNQAAAKHLVQLIRYYLEEGNGQASSRDLGRFLAANSASAQSRHQSALTQLKEEFGSLASFISRCDDFHTHSAGDSMNYEFVVSLRPSASGRKTTERIINTDSIRMGGHGDPAVTQHLEGLVREYLQASGGDATFRDVGRYLAANADSQKSRNKSALTELKEEYGNLSSFIGSSRNVFGTRTDNDNKYRVTLRGQATS